MLDTQLSWSGSVGFRDEYQYHLEKIMIKLE